MALLNFANTYAEISGNLTLPESASGDYVKLFFSKDGHIISHGKDFTPTFTPTVRGLVPVSSGKATEIFRGNATWAEITTTDLPIAENTSVNNTTTLFTTQQIHQIIDASFAANDAMRYKGTITYSNGSYTTHTVAGVEVQGFPTKCEVGDTYRVTSQGTYAGQMCSAGDLLICIQDGTGSELNTAAYWTAVEANINGQVKHTVNGTSIYVYSNSTNTFTIYAPTTGGTQKQVLISNGDAAPIWVNQNTLVVGTANKVSNALSAGSGLSMGGQTFNGSVARTITLLQASNTTFGGVTVDKDSTNKTISVSNGNIFLTSQNVINALGYVPGNQANDKAYSTILASSATGTESVTAATANPFVNLVQTQGANKTVAGTFQIIGSGKIGVVGNTAITISLGEATAADYGGIKIGYTTTGRNYAVQLSGGKAYVNVPWSNTTYGLATATADGLVPKFDALGTGALAAGSWVLAKLANGTYDWFALPSTAFSDNNTWRPIQVKGTALLGSGVNTGALNFVQGGHTSITGSGNNITISSSWRTISVGSASIGDKSLNFIPSGDVYLKTDSNGDNIQDISFGISWYNISTKKYETA